MSYCKIPSIIKNDDYDDEDECNSNSDRTREEEADSIDQDRNNQHQPAKRPLTTTTREEPRTRTLSHNDPLASERHHDEENLREATRLSSYKSKELDIATLLSKAKSTSTSTINSQQAYSFVDKLDHELIDDHLLSILDSTTLEFNPSPDTNKLHDFNHAQPDTTLSEQEEEEDDSRVPPIYKLRADPENPSQSYDWIKAPHCFDEQQISELTNEQIKFTLDYFVLSGYRVSQMTKTYDDIEAVTKLLDEKEKDLELAATIGQQLLEKNQQLDSKIEFLEKELHETVESVNQLRYEIVLKDNLLKTFIESENESSLESQHFDAAETSLRSDRRGDANSSSETLSEYKKRIIALEDENDVLRDKAEYFERETAELENKRQVQINSTKRELEQTRSILRETQEELKIKSSEYQSQQDEIQTLYTQLIELQYRVKLLTKDNTDLQFIYDSSTSSLMNQINELKEKYNDCLVLLSKTQDELLVLKSKLNLKRQSTLSGANNVSAASISGEEARSSFVVDVDSSEFPANMAYFNKTSPSWTTQNSLANELLQSTNNRNNELLEQASKTSKFLKSVKRRVARQIPGTPFDSQQSDSELDALNSEHDARFESSHFRPLSFSSGGNNNMQSSFVKFPNCRTPDSIFSTGSASIFGRSHSYMLPEKLQIVKPIEGSQTLQHWQHLATPNLGCLFETRPGISIRESSFANLSRANDEQLLRKDKKSRQFDCAIDEEDDFGVYDDDDDEDELDFPPCSNYNDDYFNSSFADEMMMMNNNNNNKSSEDDVLDQRYRSKALFSPSKVELLSKLLEKDEISRESSSHQNQYAEPNEMTKSKSLLGLIKSASAKYLKLTDDNSHLIADDDEEATTKRTKNKKQMHDDPDTPPSSPIHFESQSSGSNLLFDYFESARLKCRSAFIEPLSSYFHQPQQPRQRQERDMTSTPPGTPTVEEIEYNEELNKYDDDNGDSQKSEIKNFFDQIVSKLSLFSFKSVPPVHAPSTPAASCEPTPPAASSFVLKPSPVYASTMATELSNSKLNPDRQDQQAPAPAPPVIEQQETSVTEQPETPPCSPTPSDHGDEYNEEDIKKSAFVRVARLNPYINKSVDLASLLGSLSSLKRNQRLCKYY